ncbi:MAG: FGGY-family carbohydrate kinase [Actinomycetota bacterium]
MSLILALDIGTSGGRAVIADTSGRRVGAATRAWKYRIDANGFQELDTDLVWAALASASREAVRTSLARPDAIAAVAVTSQRTGVVFLDAKGEVLSAGPNSDARGVREGIALERSHGELVYRLAGRLPVFLYLPARLAWFRNNAPALADRIAKALSFSDWATWRLTGGAVTATEPTQAAEMLAYDVTRGSWSDALCDALSTPRKILPDLQRHATTVGSITEAAAREFGLHAGTPVVPAGGDTQCAALGLGATEPGTVAIVAGTTMPVTLVVDSPIIDNERRLWTSPHAVPGRYLLEAHCGEAGPALDWYLNLLGHPGGHLWLDEAAASAEPGAGGVTSIDTGPTRMGDYPMMRTGGLLFPIPLMALGRQPADVARAVLEGIAYGARHGMEWLAEVGVPATEVVLCGGVARSQTFGRILASVLGRPIRRAREAQASGLGGCIVGAAAAGAFGSIAEAAGVMHDRGDVVQPEPEWTAIYEGMYATWVEQRARFEQTVARVSDLG